jgi:hypothetical protein
VVLENLSRAIAAEEVVANTSLNCGKQIFVRQYFINIYYSILFRPAYFLKPIVELVSKYFLSGLDFLRYKKSEKN